MHPAQFSCQRENSREWLTGEIGYKNNIGFRRALPGPIDIETNFNVRESANAIQRF